MLVKTKTKPRLDSLVSLEKVLRRLFVLSGVQEQPIIVQELLAFGSSVRDRSHHGQRAKI